MPYAELSIVVPVYNVAPWLNECLNSIAAQTFTRFECILVDDGSTDFSGIICDSYVRKDSRFRVIHQKNMGVSVARNAGIEASTAPLIAFIDPDDFISKCFFEKQITEMRRIEADVSVAAIYEVMEDGTEGIYSMTNYLEKMRRVAYKIEMMSNNEVQDALCENLFSCVCWGKVYTRELWGESRFPPGVDLGEDMLTIPRVIIKANKAVSVTEAVYYWRHRKKSLLHGTVSYERLIKDFCASYQMVKQLCEFSSMRKYDFNALKFQYDLGCFENYLKSNPNEKKDGSRLAILMAAQTEAYQRLLKEYGDNENYFEIGGSNG